VGVGVVCVCVCVCVHDTFSHMTHNEQTHTRQCVLQ